MLRLFFKKSILLVFVAIVMVICLFVLIVLTINHTRKVEDLTNQTVESASTILSSESVSSGLVKYVSAAKTFALTGDDFYLSPLKKTKNFIQEDIIKLRNKVATNKVQIALCDSLKVYVTDKLNFADSLIILKQHNKQAQIKDFIMVAASKNSTRNLASTIDDLGQEEKNELKKITQAYNQSVLYLYIYLFGLVLLIIALFFVIFMKLKLDKKQDKIINKKEMYG